MIAIWLINCQRPFLTAEDPELIEIFRYLNPNVKPVKADAIKNTIMKLYKEGKRELKVDFTIVALCFFFLLITISGIIGVPLHYKFQNIFYIRPLDFPQQQSLCFCHSSLH